MPTIPPEARDLVLRTRLGFVATINEDGTPNLSPKGTVTVWDDSHLMFADLESPGTIRNLTRNPATEINVVHPILRKGFRFRGRGRVLSSGPEFERAVERYVAGPSDVRMEAGSAIRHVVLVDVEEVRALVSPAYRGGTSEAAMSRRWMSHYAGTATGARRRESPLSVAAGIVGVIVTVLGLMYYAFDPGISLGGDGTIPLVLAAGAAGLAILVAAAVIVTRRRRASPKSGDARYSDRWSV